MALPAEGLDLCLEIAAEDGRFYPCDSVAVESQLLRVAATQVPEPVALRYGWQPVFLPGLYSAAGIPLTPFLLRLRNDGFDYVAHLDPGEDERPASAERLARDPCNQPKH